MIWQICCYLNKSFISRQIGTNQIENGGDIGPVSVSDDDRAIWQEVNHFQFVSNMLTYEQGMQNNN